MSGVHVFVDLDSGTVLNGPIFAVDPDVLMVDGTDDDARAAALRHGTQIDDSSLTAPIYTAMKNINDLRRLGYAIVMFNPSELRNVNPQDVEDALVREGNLMIDELQSLADRQDGQRRE